MAPATKPGGDSGPVGQTEADVAGQSREQEGEGGLSDGEEDGPEVRHRSGSTQGMPGRRWKVGEGVVQGDVHAVLGDLVAAEEESQGDEQTTGSHEGNHVRYAGHEGLLEAFAPSDL